MNIEEIITPCCGVGVRIEKRFNGAQKRAYCKSCRKFIHTEKTNTTKNIDCGHGEDNFKYNATRNYWACEHCGEITVMSPSVLFRKKPIVVEKKKEVVLPEGFGGVKEVKMSEVRIKKYTQEEYEKYGTMEYHKGFKKAVSSTISGKI